MTGSRGLPPPMRAILTVFVLVTAWPGAAQADVHLAVLPAVATVGEGDVFDVELTVTPAGAAFNGYDAVVQFDPTALAFIERPRAEQEGPLMTGACSNTFHSFSVEPGGDVLTVNHYLLCAGVSLSGPGVVYRLRFQALTPNTITHIRLVDGTAFFLSGLFVMPVFTADAEVRVGPLSPVPDAPTAIDLGVAPNPFNPATTISFTSPAPGPACVEVYSARGVLVAEVLDAPVDAGPHAVVWDGRDLQGRRVGSGVYVVRVALGGREAAVRVSLIK